MASQSHQGTADTALGRRLFDTADRVGLGFATRHRRRSHDAHHGFALAGLLVGSVIAHGIILFLLGEALLAAAWPAESMSDPASLLAALGAPRDPGVVVSSLVMGGLPGAVIGRRLAIRRLRNDRLDALVSTTSPNDVRLPSVL